LNVYDYELVFGTKVNLGLDKAHRLIFEDSQMTHAMVLTAIHTKVTKMLPKITETWENVDSPPAISPSVILPYEIRLIVDLPTAS